MDHSFPEGFSVGECQVYPASNELRRADALVSLEPKVMALLLLLVENRGETVSRDRLFEELWPGVIVSDDTLTQAVIKLRKALADSAKNPRYIQTVTKRGYRLCARVDLASRAHSDVLPFRKRAFPLLALGMAVLIAGAAIAYLFSGDTTPDISSAPPAEGMRVDALPSLTVEPFTLLGEEMSQLYLAQGLTHDLITDLSKLSALWVIGSRSIMGQGANEAGTGSARYLVSGEVQRADGQIRVHVHLLDIESGHQLWSERYQRPFDDLFQLQEEISRQIAATLSIKVSEAEQARLAHRYTRNIEAYELFLQAQSLLLIREEVENDRARQLYRQAIALDPSFARAYGGLALSFAADYRNQWVTDGQKALERARTMARTALQIDPEIPEVYWVLAYVSTQQQEHEKALGLLRKAISLDQSFADAYALMGGIHTYIGRPDQTPELLRTAVRLNPDAGHLYFLLLGRAYFYLQDWEQAVINLNEALERNPASLEAHIYLAATMESSGAHQDALWEAVEIRGLQAGFDAAAWLETYPMTDRDQVENLRSVLARLGLNNG